MSQPPEEQLAHLEVPRITCEELKQLMDEGADLVIVDTRWEGSYKMEHIKGAINIPDTPIPPVTQQIIDIKLMALPWDKTIIFY